MLTRNRVWSLRVFSLKSKASFASFSLFSFFSLYILTCTSKNI